MNIANLLEKIDLFDQLVTESGFSRDVKEFLSATATPETRNNLASLRNIAEQLIKSLERIDASDLAAELDNLMPWRDSFTDNDHLTDLRSLVDDPGIPTDQFFNKLQKVLSALDSQITADSTEINTLRNVFNRYKKSSDKLVPEEGRAVMSIVLRDRESIKSIQSFSRALDKWNRNLFIYHQLVSGDAPEAFKILEVQNGSIDLIFDINVDVAIDLAQIFNVALKAFLVYLTYKSRIHEIIPTILANKKLADLEAEREKIVLEGIKVQIHTALLDQHNERRAEDGRINNESIEKKIEQVGNHIADQIIRGNEIKLLAAPEDTDDGTDGEGPASTEINRELRENAQSIRKIEQSLGDEQVKLLIESYKESDNFEGETEISAAVGSTDKRSARKRGTPKSQKKSD
jgi:hypothetical protein